jgi:hypothetical protein
VFLQGSPKLRFQQRRCEHVACRRHQIADPLVTRLPERECDVGGSVDEESRDASSRSARNQRSAPGRLTTGASEDRAAGGAVTSPRSVSRSIRMPRLRREVHGRDVPRVQRTPPLAEVPHGRGGLRGARARSGVNVRRTTTGARQPDSPPPCSGRSWRTTLMLSTGKPLRRACSRIADASCPFVRARVTMRVRNSRWGSSRRTCRPGYGARPRRGAPTPRTSDSRRTSGRAVTADPLASMR